MFLIIDILIVAALLLVMLLAQELGRRIGEGDRRRAGGEGNSDDKSSAPAAGAVYAVLGLLLAFTFSGAGSRYEHRYQLAIDEANAIGTAWLRLDALPAASQPPLRDAFRRYVEARIAMSPLGPGSDAYVKESARFHELQNLIWSGVMDALIASGQTPLYGVVLTPINEMIDLTSTRDAASMLHPPAAVFVMLCVFLVVGAMYAGHAMAGKPRSRFHMLAFPMVLSLVIFVIVDFEYPRFGFIRLNSVDAMFVDLRHSMQ